MHYFVVTSELYLLIVLPLYTVKCVCVISSLLEHFLLSVLKHTMDVKNEVIATIRVSHQHTSASVFSILTSFSVLWVCYRWTWDRKQVSPIMCFCQPLFPSVVLPNLAWSGRELWWVYSILSKVSWKISAGLSRCAPVLPLALHPGRWPLRMASLAAFGLSDACDFGKRPETGKRVLRLLFH